MALVIFIRFYVRYLFYATNSNRRCWFHRFNDCGKFSSGVKFTFQIIDDRQETEVQ